MDGIQGVSDALYAVAISMLAISYLAVVIRVFVRVRNQIHIIADEAVILLTAILGITLSIVACYLSKAAISDGFAGIVSERIYKLSIAFLACYKITSTLAKTSVLLHYRRCFTSTWFIRLYRGLMVILLSGLIVSLSMTLLQCDPLLHMSPDKLERCGDFRVFWIYDSSFMLGMCIVITILPMPWMLPVFDGGWDKFDVGIIFCFGLCAGLCMHVLLGRENSGNELAKLLAYYTWCIVEANMTLLYACALGLRRPLRNMPTSSQVPQSFRMNERSRGPANTNTALVNTSRSDPIRIDEGNTGTGPGQESPPTPVTHRTFRDSWMERPVAYVSVRCRSFPSLRSNSPPLLPIPLPKQVVDQMSEEEVMRTIIMNNDRELYTERDL